MGARTTAMNTLKDCIEACSSSSASSASALSSSSSARGTGVTGLLLFVGDVVPLRTKRGDVVRVASLTLADQTATVTIKLWGDRTAWIRAGRVRLGDIVRLTHLRFRQVRPGHVEASSSWYTSVTTLWRLGKFAPKMTVPVKNYVHGLLAWQQAGAYKGLFDLARERSSFTSASGELVAGGARTRLEIMSDKECIDVVARLKIVYSSPATTVTSGRAAGATRVTSTRTTAASRRSTSTKESRFAILAEDGRNVEFALKLWGAFSRPGWVAELRECVGQLVQCKRLLVRHCPFMDTLVLNTCPNTTICVLPDNSGTDSGSSAGRLSIGLTPSPMNLEVEAPANNDADKGVDVSVWALKAKNRRDADGGGTANQERRDEKARGIVRRMLSVGHLLACEVDGLIRLDAHFVRWEVVNSSTANVVGSHVHSSGASTASAYVDSFASIIQSLLMRVCARCGASMNTDRNNIVCCSRGCAPLPARASSGDEERAWKWAYREGQCVLRDPPSTTSATVGRRAQEITVHTPPTMVQHLLVGIPPESLMDSQASQAYKNATGLNPRVVVARQIEALLRPGICPVRTIVDCARAVDKNGQLMLGGCTYSLCRFELI